MGGGTRRGSAGSAGGVGSAAPTPSYGSSHVLCVPASRTRSTWRLFWRVPAPLAVHWGWALALPPRVGHAAHGPEQLARPEPPVQQVPSPPQLSSPERWSRDASDCSLLTAPSYLCWGREAPSLPTTALRCPSVDDPSQLSPYLLTKKMSGAALLTAPTGCLPNSRLLLNDPLPYSASTCARFPWLTPSQLYFP